MRRYRQIARKAPNPGGRSSLLSFLCATLPRLWEADYASMTRSPSQLLTITFRDRHGPDGFLGTMFDHASAAGAGPAGTEDRVVAVWGLSQPEPASTRDKQRMAGYLKGVWSDAYPGDDRGHFFAHTMGGGTDINLFPQLARINRGGRWRQLERFAAANPGTFCFIHPIYSGTSWRPAGLEYGLYTLPPALPFSFDGEVFGN